jgi:hypothetical protein
VIVRVLRVAAWLAIAGAIVAGLYWAFLNTPESNALTLTASALLIVAVVVSAAVGVNAAVLLARDGHVRDSLRAAARRIGWFLIAAIPALLIWWATMRADAWVSRHSGEISAWFIARFGWADIGWLFASQAWISRWIRWAVVPVVVLTLLTSFFDSGLRSLASVGWLRRVLHWRTLVTATLVFVLLFALPWQLTAWRPMLPATWVEPTVAAIRLGVAAMAIALGSAFLVTIAARPPGVAPPSPSAPPLAPPPPV